MALVQDSVNDMAKKSSTAIPWICLQLYKESAAWQPGLISRLLYDNSEY